MQLNSGELGVRQQPLALQHQTHRDISSPDPLDGFVHSCEGHDIDDSRDAMLRREREHLHGIRTTPYVVPIDGSPETKARSIGSALELLRRIRLPLIAGAGLEPATPAL